MKRLFLILILTFIFQSLSKADDIRDFEIEGISIGNSLLDFYSKSEIKKNTLKEAYPKNNTMQRVQFNLVDKTYQSLMIHYKKNDNKFIIFGILGSLEFKDFNDCYKTSKKISKELDKIFPNIKVKKYEKKHAADKSGKSTNKGYTYWFTNKSFVNIACYDWSQKMGYRDHLRVEIVGEEFQEFLRLNFG
jgi:hypothetical protein